MEDSTLLLHELLLACSFVLVTPTVYVNEASRLDDLWNFQAPIYNYGLYGYASMISGTFTHLNIVMANTVMANIVMANIVMANIVMAR